MRNPPPPGADTTSETVVAITEPHIRVGPMGGCGCGTPPPPSSRNPRAGHGRVAGVAQGHVGRSLHQGGTQRSGRGDPFAMRLRELRQRRFRLAAQLVMQLLHRVPKYSSCLWSPLPELVLTGPSTICSSFRLSPKVKLPCCPVLVHSCMKPLHMEMEVMCTYLYACM